MNTAVHPAAVNRISARQLWAAVIVLGIAVIALAASLVHIQTRPVDGHAVLVDLVPEELSITPSATENPPASPLPVTSVGPGETVLASPVPAAAAPAASPPPPATATKLPKEVPPAKPAQPAATQAPSARPSGKAAPAPAAAVLGTQANAPTVLSEAGPLPSRPVAPAARPICANCGRVESVTAIDRKAEASGTGAIAGGVLGAVVGNQVGKGNGRALATVLGAVGGGLAGNTIEKNMGRTTVYQVQVRMEDGSLRMLEQASAPAVGSAVVVEGQTLRAADGSAPATQRTPAAPAAVPQAKTYSSER